MTQVQTSAVFVRCPNRLKNGRDKYLAATSLNAALRSVSEADYDRMRSQVIDPNLAAALGIDTEKSSRELLASGSDAIQIHPVEQIPEAST